MYPLTCLGGSILLFLPALSLVWASLSPSISWYHVIQLDINLEQTLSLSRTCVINSTTNNLQKQKVCWLIDLDSNCNIDLTNTPYLNATSPFPFPLPYPLPLSHIPSCHFFRRTHNLLRATALTLSIAFIFKLLVTCFPPLNEDDEVVLYLAWCGMSMALVGAGEGIATMSLFIHVIHQIEQVSNGTTRSTHGYDGGFAMIAVTWILALVSAICFEIGVLKSMFESRPPPIKTLVHFVAPPHQAMSETDWTPCRTHESQSTESELPLTPTTTASTAAVVEIITTTPQEQ